MSEPSYFKSAAELKRDKNLQVARKFVADRVIGSPAQIYFIMDEDLLDDMKFDSEYYSEDRNLIIWAFNEKGYFVTMMDGDCVILTNSSSDIFRR